MRRGKSADALTDEEVAFLRSDRAAESVRRFAARQHESIGVRASAYRKVAAAARAERSALMEIAALEVTRAAAAGQAAVADRVRDLEADRVGLEKQLKATRRALEAATAAPAMAVHSEVSQ